MGLRYYTDYIIGVGFVFAMATLILYRHDQDGAAEIMYNAAIFLLTIGWGVVLFNWVGYKIRVCKEKRKK